MDTRWKNIIEKIYKIYNGIHMPGLFLTAIGLVGFWIMIIYRRSYSTRTVLNFGIVGNLCVGIGAALLLNRYLSGCYRDWSGKEGHDYEDWKTAKEGSLKRMYKTGSVWCMAAVFYLCFLIYSNSVYGGWGGWIPNYATGYVMVITALIQLLICQNVIEVFWHRKLNGVIEYVGEHMEELQRIRLEEALEIEKRSLEKASRSDQLRVDLITNVSHDLKTPLTSIVGYVELIKKEELSDVVRDYVDVISSRTEKLGEMINSLFSLAKASSGNIELKKENFDVNRLIEQIFADMDDRIKESDLKFVPQLTEDDTEICSDNMYFYRICQNLMENALKYSAKGTRVFVKTYLKDVLDKDVLDKDVLNKDVLNKEALEGETTQEHQKTQDGASDTSGDRPESGPKKNIRIEITNTAGYPMDFAKEDIVERFVRGDQARTSEGNGLGLAIVSSYTKALGGEFDIRIDCDQFRACLEFPGSD